MIGLQVCGDGYLGTVDILVPRGGTRMEKRDRFVLLNNCLGCLLSRENVSISVTRP